MRISATIIALNESADIVECIRSVRQVADEVLVVVDTKTTDDTAELARAAGARVMHQEYLGDGPQKAVAVPQATYDWIFSIDADERLEEDCVAAIRGLDLTADDVDAYAVRRRNFVGGHWIKAAGFYPGYVVRLYHRERAGYHPKKGHSYVQARRVRRLPVHLSHRTYEDLSHWVDRLNALSTRDAWAMYERGKRASRLAPGWHALVAFVRKFFLKGGCLQGSDGLAVTMTATFRTWLKYVKLREMMVQKGDIDRW